MNVSFRDVVPDDATVLAHILVISNSVAFRGVVPDHVLEFTETESATNWRRTLVEGLPAQDFMIVAVAAAEVVGYAWGGPSKSDALYQGELRQVMVLPSYWQQGIGRSLVRQVATRLAGQGIDSLRVEVLKINPNRAFYQRLGGHFVSEYLHDWDGFISPMYIYGWVHTQGLRES